MSFDSAAMGVLFFGAVLLPLFFVPAFGFAIDTGKALFLAAMVLLSFLFWLLARLKGGSLSLPLSPLLPLAGLIVAVFIVSALFTPAPQNSFYGLVYETGTTASIAVLFILMFLSSLFLGSNRIAIYLYQSLLVVFGIVFLFWISRLSGVDVLSFNGLFEGKTGNLVGKWNDLGVFAGFIALLSLITLEKVSLSKRMTVLLYCALAASLAMLSVVNFYLVWFVLGIFSLVLFVYHFSSARFAKDKTNNAAGRAFSYPSTIVLVASLVFVIAGGAVGGFINEKLGIAQLEVRPSWASTGIILKETIKEHPLFGSGPNRFAHEWAQFKPESVNNSPFWNTEFRLGIGLLPSFVVTTGVLGAVSWGLFLVFFLYSGVRSLFAPSREMRLEYIIFSSFILALYLWIISFFYVPTVAMFALAFLITGMFIGALTEAGVVKRYTFSYFEDPRAGFISVLILSVLIIGTATAGYAFSKKILALKHFQAGRAAFAAGDLAGAEEKIKKAVAQNQSDTYYRSIAEIKTQQLSAFLARTDVSPEAVRAEFQAMLGDTIAAGQQAVQIDRTYYANWLTLARVYGAVVPFVAGAYENARIALAESLALYPKNPVILFEHARLEIANQNFGEARRYIREALTMKPDYANAIFLLARVEFTEGNVPAAIESIGVATLAAPNDAGLFFQLGLLKHNTGDFSGAAEALLRAVELSPQFANARYFLGLSFYNLNRTPDAIQQFEALVESNPDNAEVGAILQNLRNGKAPFAALSEQPPEEYAEPPLEE